MWTGVLIGTMGSISSETWPTIWLILEVNLISFLPIISIKIQRKKISMIYFVVQRVGSLALLASIVSDLRTLTIKWIGIGLILKACLAPLHFWGPSLVTTMTQTNLFFFLTWQKIAPLFLIFKCLSKSWLLFIVILNSILSAFCRIGSKNLSILIFFSRLIHVSWVLSGPVFLATYYYVTYILMTAPIFFLGWRDYPILFLNIAGIPPITGFLLKMILLPTIRVALIGILLRTAGIILFAYLRVFIIGKSLVKMRVSWPTVFTCLIGLVLV